MLGDNELERFARQLILAGFEEEHQAQLQASHVAVLGAGGLGSPLILYLVAAGVGQLTIIDDDSVELSNLNRQVIHPSKAIGVFKASSAKKTAQALDSDIKITTHEKRFSNDNAEELIGEASIIADCSDTAETRYEVSQAAHRLGKIHVFGGATRLEGQVSTFASGVAKSSPCFACVFPESATPSHVPRCSEVGILGAITGIIGSLMALEVLRQCLLPAKPLGEGLERTLLLFDGQTSELQRITTKPRADCSICG